MGSKNYLIAAASVAVALVFVYGLYLLGSALLAGAHHEEANPYELLINAIGKPGKYTTYTYEYTDYIDDYPITTTIVYTPTFSTVKMKSPVFEKAVYTENGADVLCIDFNKEETCSLAFNTSLAPTAAQLRGYIPGLKAAKNVEAMKIFNRSGALSFIGEVEEHEVDGTPCKTLSYMLDYSKLTLTDLNDLGLSPSDPSVVYSKNYTFEYCIDNESNIVSIKLDYYFKGEKRATESVFAKPKWGVADRAEMAHTELINASKTETHFIDAINAEKNLLACSKNATTKDTCIRNYAVLNGVPDLCLMAGASKDSCLLILAPQKIRPDLCPSVDDAALRDDCGVEMGARLENSTYCMNIANGSKRQYCIEIVANASANAPECTTDADCFTTGCSGQLCRLLGVNVTTTCEMRPEYECLALSSCGCVEGSCGWDQNQDYLDCLENKTVAQ